MIYPGMMTSKARKKTHKIGTAPVEEQHHLCMVSFSGMVGWLDGGMVGWWDGGMVGWWDGWMVGW